MAIGIAGSTLWTGLGPSQTAAAEVQLESTSSAGPSPFMSPVGQDQPSTIPPALSGGEFSGDTPGLFADTGDKPSCDAQSLIANLQADATKAAAWVDALGLQAEDIPSYVTSLGPLVLCSDTVGTSHGYTEGRFLAYPAVLQAGTAVFVNSYGEPKVKCYSGNPLTLAVSSSQASYSGPAWEHFTPTSVTVIDRTPTVINNYTFVNVHQGTTIHRSGKTPGPNDDNWHLVTLTGAEDSRQDLPHPELGAVDPRCRALLAADEHQAVECALWEAEKAAPSFDNRWLIALADYQLGQRARQQGEAGRAEVSYQRRLPGGARGIPPWRRRIAGGSDDSRGRAPKLRSGHPPPRRHRASAWSVGRPTRRAMRHCRLGRTRCRTTPSLRSRGRKAKRSPPTKPWPTCRGRGASIGVPRWAGPASPPPSVRWSSSSPRAEQHPDRPAAGEPSKHTSGTSSRSRT